MFGKAAPKKCLPRTTKRYQKITRTYRKSGASGLVATFFLVTFGKSPRYLLQCCFVNFGSVSCVQTRVCFIASYFYLEFVFGLIDFWNKWHVNLQKIRIPKYYFESTQWTDTKVPGKYGMHSILILPCFFSRRALPIMYKIRNRIPAWSNSFVV